MVFGHYATSRPLHSFHVSYIVLLIFARPRMLLQRGVIKALNTSTFGAPSSQSQMTEAESAADLCEGGRTAVA
jgi:hypothetical protein